MAGLRTDGKTSPGAYVASSLSGPALVEDRTARVCGVAEGLARVPTFRTGVAAGGEFHWHPVQSLESVSTRGPWGANHFVEATGGSEGACTLGRLVVGASFMEAMADKNPGVGNSTTRSSAFAIYDG